MTLLPVEPAWRLKKRSEEHRWLVAGLWAEQAVGIVGGEPKCCKSFCAPACKFDPHWGVIGVQI